MAEERNVKRIDELRQQIDDIDAQLVELLSKRAACALAIGHEKKLVGLSPRVKRRSSLTFNASTRARCTTKR